MTQLHEPQQTKQLWHWHGSEEEVVSQHGKQPFRVLARHALGILHRQRRILQPRRRRPDLKFALGEYGTAASLAAHSRR